LSKLAEDTHDHTANNNNSSHQHHHHNHNGAKNNNNNSTAHSHHLSLPKICPRHRVPSVGSSEAGGGGSSYPKSNELFGYKSGTGGRSSGTTRSRRSRSHLSTSELASSVDLNEFRLSKSYYAKHKRPSPVTNPFISASVPSNNNKLGAGRNSSVYVNPLYNRKSMQKNSRKSSTGIIIPEANESLVNVPSIVISHHGNSSTNNNRQTGSMNIGNGTTALLNRTSVRKENSNRVHFSLTNTSDDDEEVDDVDSSAGSGANATAAVPIANSKAGAAAAAAVAGLEKLSMSNETFDADKLFQQALSSSEVPVGNCSDDDDDVEEDAGAAYRHAFARHSLNNMVDDVEMAEVEDDSCDAVKQQTQFVLKDADPSKIVVNSVSSGLLFGLEDAIESGPAAASNSNEAMNLDCEGKKSSIEWENYWDNLEFNALGKLNI
jgi:hypothetical protein